MKIIKLRKVSDVNIFKSGKYELSVEYMKRILPAVSTWDITMYEINNEIFVAEFSVFEHVGNADLVNEFMLQLDIKFEIEVR